MRLDQNPVFRKVIVPWYDSETACLILVVCISLVLLFGFAGVSVARENAGYREYIWVPVALIVLSAWVIVSITIRLIRRYFQGFSK
jgi:GMP synthase-like glutamine amidotransferase